MIIVIGVLVMVCEECYSELNRITPLNDSIECLTKHTQYICGHCGRCICFEKDAKRNVMRWNFPFSKLEDAKLYLRTADVYFKKNCGIYELTSDTGRAFYKIFESKTALLKYLAKNKDKHSQNEKPVFEEKKFIEYSETQIRKLTEDEIKQYYD